MSIGIVVDNLLERSFCAAESSVTGEPPPSETELCNAKFDPGYREFYEPSIVGGKVTCVSICDPLAKSYYNCTPGSCQLKNNTGPHCLCPDTDKYVYTGSTCQGRIIKIGLYGGVGAAIAVLVIIIFTVVFLMLRIIKSKKEKNLFTNGESSWYEEYNDNEWSIERGFTNLNAVMEEAGGDMSSQGSYSSKERFKPALENVDTSIEVKIQRPEISQA
ncbi:mucin-12-like [Pelobates fuscus]|uniref:mucin-12-like n=1 Tax=Pelobates fuscus TaxID=191477 RepID=UPI002FE4D7E8